jgi:hypothetical protein
MLCALSIAGLSAEILRTVRRHLEQSAPRRRTVRDAQCGFLRPSLGLCLPPSAGGCDGHFKGLSSIRILLGHHFPARNFIIPIGLSRVTDDYLFAFALIGCAWPN